MPMWQSVKLVQATGVRKLYGRRVVVQFGFNSLKSGVFWQPSFLHRLRNKPDKPKKPL